MSEVPAIDIAGLYTDGDAGRRAIGKAVAHACEAIGFFQVVGHRVAPALIDDVRAVALAFFDLPADEKARYRPPAGVLLRGYTPPETSTLARSRQVETPPDMREIMTACSAAVTGAEYPEFPGARLFYNPNIWPDRPAALPALCAA